MRTQWSLMKTQKLLISMNQWTLFWPRQLWVGFLSFTSSFLMPPTCLFIALLHPSINSYLSNQFLHISHKSSAPNLTPLYFIISHYNFLMYKYNQVIWLFKTPLDSSVWATGTFLIGALYFTVPPPIRLDIVLQPYPEVHKAVPLFPASAPDIHWI